jgi:hypothetical protein
MGFNVKNPSKRSVSLKKRLGGEKKANSKSNFFLSALNPKLRRVEDEKSSPLVGRPFL